ncbi:hypothetical protein NEFER03_2145 [Nematocida sp. LUAm3]|nr:hypothetical protein NEFER03_2145 [Nematocida sp. LUAm3]KAI5174616.1 hypothetical protein NEFER02_0737 [Nematocida sp. LUAm2]KAI5177978.1 hypothetical protein NEFER01_1160 [Nematocida sp. LUAm1]
MLELTTQNKLSQHEAICQEMQNNSVTSVCAAAKKPSKKSPEIKFSFENIQFKSVLKNVSNSLHSGKMTAILGPSGAGKTTLLKIISGRKQKTSGRIILNKKELSEKRIRKNTAFVHQENHLLPTLTVEEMLLYTIMLKAPKEKNPEALKNKLLETLHLSHVKKSIIGDSLDESSGISGGERKRLSVAQELISMPGILFLDEPTSGLDSHTSESLILHLKALANKGLLVAMTIHQPSSEIFSLFDNIILMRKGSIIYSGTVTECLEYLKELNFECPQYTNPADHLFRVLDHLPHDQNKVIETPEEPIYKQIVYPKHTLSDMIRETRILISRNFLCSFRNKKYVIAKFAQAFLMAVITGLLMYNIPAQLDYQKETNVHGCFWAVCMGVFGSFSYGAISILFLDKKIVIKEYGSNYYTFLPYFIAKVTVDFIITCVHPFIAVPFIFFCAGIGGIFHVLSCALLAGVGHALGLLVSSFVETSDIALAIFPGVVYPINMLTGNTVDTESIVPWLRSLQYISPTRHVFNIMIKLHYKDRTDLSPKVQSMVSSFVSVYASIFTLILFYIILISLTGISLKRRMDMQAKG